MDEARVCAGGGLELPGPRAAVALPGTGMLLSYHPGHERFSRCSVVTAGKLFSCFRAEEPEGNVSFTYQHSLAVSLPIGSRALGYQW